MFGEFHKSDRGKPCPDDASVEAGDPVTVRNEKGTTVALADLEPGKIRLTRPVAATCRFPFTVEDIDSAKFYRFHVRRAPPAEFSRREIEDQDWTVELSITPDL